MPKCTYIGTTKEGKDLMPDAFGFVSTKRTPDKRFYQIGPGYANKPVSLLFAPHFGGKGVYENVPNIWPFGFEVLSQGRYTEGMGQKFKRAHISGNFPYIKYRIKNLIMFEHLNLSLGTELLAHELLVHMPPDNGWPIPCIRCIVV